MVKWLKLLCLALPQSPQHISRSGRPADDRPLRPDHVQGSLLKGWEIAGSSIFDQQALITPVIRLAHGRLHIDLCSHPGQDEMRDIHGRQQLQQIGVVESALARFFKHYLARLWRQSWHDGVTRFSGNEDAPHGTGVTDPQRRLTALAFGRRAVREIRAMSFFRMDNGPSEGTEAV